eukprot:gene25011-30501_t
MSYQLNDECNTSHTRYPCRARCDTITNQDRTRDDILGRHSAARNSEQVLNADDLPRESFIPDSEDTGEDYTVRGSDPRLPGSSYRLARDSVSVVPDSVDEEAVHSEEYLPYVSSVASPMGNRSASVVPDSVDEDAEHTIEPVSQVVRQGTSAAKASVSVLPISVHHHEGYIGEVPARVASYDSPLAHDSIEVVPCSERRGKKARVAQEGCWVQQYKELMGDGGPLETP